MMRRWNGLIEEYKEWLPVTEKTPELTLQEGNTPLIHLKNLIRTMGHQPLRENGRDKSDRFF